MTRITRIYADCLYRYNLLSVKIRVIRVICVLNYFFFPFLGSSFKYFSKAAVMEGVS